MELTLVKTVEAFREGQIREVYRSGDQYIVVSTVPNLGEDLDTFDKGIVDMAALFGGYATSGEETMAFLCDEDGEPISWSELAVATGSNSRANVLSQLEDLDELYS